VDSALDEYSKLMPRMLVENLRHGSRAAHARVHSAFSPEEALGPPMVINGSDLLALHQQAVSGDADISGEEEGNN
jgi:hypothetical protein